jgi:hypothetical protein
MLFQYYVRVHARDHVTRLSFPGLESQDLKPID